MKAQIEKLDAACQKFTEHEFVNATLLGVAGILTMITYLSPVLNGTV